MRAAIASNSGEAEDSASHHALLNQCRKSSTPSDFENTIAKCVGKASSNARSTIFVPQMELNARFNEMAFITRALQEQYRCCRVDVYPCPIEALKGAFVVTLGFDDAAGIRRFYVQGMVWPDGTLATGSGRMEPKFFLTDDMVAYKPLHQRKEDNPRRA